VIGGFGKLYTYWPCAILIKKDGTEEQISTYDSFGTEEEARKQFDVWKNGYKFELGRCWIELYYHGIYTASKTIEF